jgi:hypothetical protein
MNRAINLLLFCSGLSMPSTLAPHLLPDVIEGRVDKLGHCKPSPEPVGATFDYAGEGTGKAE